MKQMPLTVIACGLSACALATDIAVDNYERVDLSVTNGAVTVDGSVFYATRGVALEKTGSDTLTFPTASVQTRRPFTLNVLEGDVVVTNGTAPVLAQPACMQTAALWLDASQADTLVSPDGAANGEVARWYDVRERKDESGNWGQEYYSAEAKISFVTNQTPEGTWEKVIRYPVRKTVAETGRKYVDFNGKASGSWMRFMTAANKPGTTERADLGQISGIRHVFFCGNVVDSWGFLLAGSSGYSDFWQPSNTGGGVGNLYGPNSSLPGVFSGWTYFNGELVNGSSFKIPTGPYAYEWHAGIVAAYCGNFFNDRNIWSAANGFRCGGDSVGEVVLFTNRLTSAERQAVGEYLLRKWAKPAAPGAVSVQTARGGRLEIAKGTSAVIDGDGRALIPGGQTYAYSQKRAYNGDTRVISGTAKLNSAEPELAVAAGDALTVTRDGCDVLSVAATTDAPSGEARLSLAKDTFVRVSGLEGDAKKLSVTGEGTLILSATNSESRLRTGGDIFATMENPDFEEYTRQSPTGSTLSLNVGKKYGWDVVEKTSSVYFINLENALAGTAAWMIYGSGAAGRRTYNYVNYPFQGKSVLTIKQGAIVETQVTFPKAGEYELTFLTGGRTDGSVDQYAGGWAHMSLVRAGETNKIGTAFAYLGLSMQHQRFRVPHVEAGAYTFRINHAVGTGDSHSIFDDFKFRLVTEKSEEVVVRPPNGDFEQVTPTWANRCGMSWNNKVDGWTLTRSAAGEAGKPDVCLVTRGMTDTMYSDSGSAYGGVQLAFYGAGGTATSSEFTLPAGTWKLRCRSGSIYCNEGSGYKWNGLNTVLGSSRVVQAVLLEKGDAQIDMGTSSTSYSSQSLEDRTFANAIVLTEPKTVRLKIWQTTAATSSAVPCVLVDDFEFVRQNEADELIANGKFPDSTGWTIKAVRDLSTTVFSNATRLANASVGDPIRLKDSPDFNGAPYGSNLGVNNRALDFCQCGRATRPVHFDEPGLYRLRLSSRSRVWENENGTVNMGYGGNQVAVFLADEQGNTNEIYRTPSVYATNFTFRSALFRVANAGDYTFGLMSLNGMPLPDGTALKVGTSGSDCEIFVDQVSVKKAAEADGGPQLPEDFALHLAAGTKLRLDFAGTNRIGSCRIDGRVASGYIDASHPSGLVVGTGCLYVEPKGSFFLVR